MSKRCDRCGKELNSAYTKSLCFACDDWLNAHYPKVTPIKVEQPAASAWRKDTPTESDGYGILGEVLALCPNGKPDIVHWSSVARYPESYIAWAVINPYEATP